MTSSAGDTALQAFIELSGRLVGTAVDPDLAAAYRARLLAQPFGAALPEIEARFAALCQAGPVPDATLREQLLDPQPYRETLRQLILLWYSSAFSIDGEWRFGTPDQHFRALIWPTIGAHPPALSGGYFGYWKYPPEH